MKQTSKHIHALLFLFLLAPVKVAAQWETVEQERLIIVDKNVPMPVREKNIANIKQQPVQTQKKDSTVFYAGLYKEWEELFKKKEYDKAFSALKKAAEGDYPSALDDLAYQLFKGSVYTHDIELAEYYARRGADLGYVDCQLWLGQILRETNRKEEALQWFEKSGKRQGWSAYLAGEMYEKGEGTPMDTDKAIYWYRISSKNSFNRYKDKAKIALRRLTRKDVYEEGEYMKYVKEADVGYGKIPQRLYEDEGCHWSHRSPEEFAAILAAAEQGYPEAQKMLCEILVSQDAKRFGIYDESESKKWLNKYIKSLEAKVKEGDKNAMKEMGEIYYLGYYYIKQNVSLAESYYRMGAKLGHELFQLRLGYILKEKGKKEEALKWFIKSGEQGQGMSAYLAGEMFEKGEGTKTSVSKAIEWYVKSANTADSYAENAKKALERLGQPIPTK